jgi:hypothetical protein
VQPITVNLRLVCILLHSILNILLLTLLLLQPILPVFFLPATYLAPPTVFPSHDASLYSSSCCRSCFSSAYAAYPVAFHAPVTTYPPALVAYPVNAATSPAPPAAHHTHEFRVSFETSFDSKQPKLEPKLVSALSETKRLFRLFSNSFCLLNQNTVNILSTTQFSSFSYDNSEYKLLNIHIL